MHKVQTTVSFEAAHRLHDVATYSEECRNNLHGHSYYVTVLISREHLNDAGMVIDFKLLKKILHETIEERYDHSCILKSSDPLCSTVSTNCKKVHIVDSNPTAEWMAKHFYDTISGALADSDPGIEVVSVAVQETDKNIAVYER